MQWRENSESITHDKFPRQINSGTHRALILEDLDADSGFEHDDYFGLVEHVRRRIDGDSW